MKDEPAIALLRSRGHAGNDDTNLGEIARAVDGLPLALEMLAVRLGVPGTTATALLDELSTAPTVVEMTAFEEAGGPSIERVDGVFAALKGTLDRLEPDVRERIAPLGYLADAPVSKLLVMALAGVDERGYGELVAACRRESVLTADGETVRLHALTVAAIQATNPDGAPEVAVSAANKRLMAVATDDPIAFRAEVAHYERLRTHASLRLGDEDATTLRFTNNLAVGYWAVGRNDEALALDEGTLRIRTRLLGDDHRDTLSSRNNLAIRYSEAGRNAEAIELNEATLGIMDRVLGRGYPDALSSRLNLAGDYLGAGRNDEAIELNEATLGIMEQVLGPEHSDTLRCRNNLAIGYRAVGRTDEAIQLDEETLRVQERVLGAEHSRHAREPRQPREQLPRRGPERRGDRAE